MSEADDDPKDSPLVRQVLYTTEVGSLVSSFVAGLLLRARPARVKKALQNIVDHFGDHVAFAKGLAEQAAAQKGEPSGWQDDAPTEELNFAPPPEAEGQLLGVWRTAEGDLVILNKNLFKERGAWGRVLVDIARQVARSYQTEQGDDPDEVLDAMRESLDEEWEHPTTDVQDLRRH